MAIFKDDEGNPVDAKDAGEVMLRSAKGIAKGATKVLTGDLKGAKQEYEKTKEDNDEIMERVKKKRAMLYDNPRSNAKDD